MIAYRACAFAAFLQYACMAACGERVAVRFAGCSGDAGTLECSTADTVFKVSGHLQALVGKCSGRPMEVALECRPEAFGTVARLLDGKPLASSLGVDEVVSVRRLAELLKIPRGRERTSLYRGLAGATSADEGFREQMQMHKAMPGIKE